MHVNCQSSLLFVIKVDCCSVWLNIIQFNRECVFFARRFVYCRLNYIQIQILKDLLSDTRRETRRGNNISIFFEYLIFWPVVKSYTCLLEYHNDPPPSTDRRLWLPPPPFPSGTTLTSFHQLSAVLPQNI